MHLLRQTVLASAGFAVLSGAAYAQDAAPADQGFGFGEVVVTARKRDETSIAVPVAVSAIGANEIQARGITNVDAVARTIPQLVIGEGGGTPQGGIISIRGISGADSNPFGDQAVSFNIDGVQVARASVRRMSEMDIEQIEVLKGPQALFYGKNSPGGIISIRTADPTDTLQAKVSAGYEFEAREIRTEGYISGPITDTLGFRVAGYFSDMKGYSKNVQPDLTGNPNFFPAADSRSPNTEDLAGRLTLKWEPSDRFDARFKFSYAQTKGSSTTGNVQLVNCALGTPQAGGIDDCRADDQITVGDIGPNFHQYDSRFSDGPTYLNQRQFLSGLEMNYHLTDTLTLTSVTGFYKVRIRNMANYTANYLDTGVPPATILASHNFVDIRELNQELRLTTDFDGPVNLMFGGLFQDSKATNGSVTAFNAHNPQFVNNYRMKQDGTAYSVFGQAMVEVLPAVELSVGARYSYEKKKLPIKETASRNDPYTLVNLNEGLDAEESFNNLSPEATISYRPTSDLTLYGSYKEGFLSGGFNSGAADLTRDNRYDQQLVKGWEGGIKASLFNGDLRTNFALYSYKTTGLQVTVTYEGTTQELRNAGSVRTKGAEFDFSYRTPIDGLSLHGAVAYNRGRYLDYQASCYRGQSSATCFPQLNRSTGEMALLQELSGTQLARAPEWSGNIGFNYEQPISDTLKVGLLANLSHSDGYFTDVTSTPGGRQKDYQLLDATLRLSEIDDRWELALIGRNLTNKYYFVRSSDSPFTGSAPGTSLNGTLGDTIASVSRGREIMLRATWNF